MIPTYPWRREVPHGGFEACANFVGRRRKTLAPRTGGGARSPRRGRPAASNLDRDALATLRATRVDHGASAGRLHPHAESVRFLSMGDRRLERAFHEKTSLIQWGEKREIIADRRVERHFRRIEEALRACG